VRLAAKINQASEAPIAASRTRIAVTAREGVDVCDAGSAWLGEDRDMPAVSRVEDLREAVAEFVVTDLDLPFEPAALAVMRRSLDETGLVLLGEVHGVAQNPLIVRGLMGVLGITSIAVEWPIDLVQTVESFLRSGTLTDHPMLWLGDGRITAGHLRVFHSLRAAGPLVVTLFDPPIDAGTTVDETWSRRDEAMATRLLGSAAATVPTLVVAGNAHTETARSARGLPLGTHLAARRPGLRNIRIRYRAGGFYNFGSGRFHHMPWPRRRCGLYSARGGLLFALPHAYEAVVPHRADRALIEQT